MISQRMLWQLMGYNSHILWNVIRISSGYIMGCNGNSWGYHGMIQDFMEWQRDFEHCSYGDLEIGIRCQPETIQAGAMTNPNWLVTSTWFKVVFLIIPKIVCHISWPCWSHPHVSTTWGAVTAWRSVPWSSVFPGLLRRLLTRSALLVLFSNGVKWANWYYELLF